MILPVYKAMKVINNRQIKIRLGDKETKRQPHVFMVYLWQGITVYYDMLFKYHHMPAKRLYDMIKNLPLTFKRNLYIHIKNFLLIFTAVYFFKLNPNEK